MVKLSRLSHPARLDPRDLLIAFRLEHSSLPFSPYRGIFFFLLLSLFFFFGTFVPLNSFESGLHYTAPPTLPTRVRQPSRTLTSKILVFFSVNTLWCLISPTYRYMESISRYNTILCSNKSKPFFDNPMKIF